MTKTFLNGFFQGSAKEVDCMLSTSDLILYMIFATLLAIVYSLKRMFLLEKRIASIEMNIERLLETIASEEKKIEQKEEEIMQKLSGKKKKSK